MLNNSFPSPATRLGRRVAAVTLSFMCLATADAAGAATAPTVEDLQDQVSRLNDRVGELERQLARVLAATGEATPAGSSPSAAPRVRAQERSRTEVVLPGETTVSAGGRIKLDAIYNSHSTGGASGANRADFALSPGRILFEGGGEDHQGSYTARESRLWFTARTDTPLVDLAGHVELDFFSGDDSGNERVSNSYVPRLRHAYARVGEFTMGQTYTTFLNVSAYPELNEGSGPVGILNVRQPMLRYESVAGPGRWLVALENPETTLTTVSGDRIAPDDDRFPDLVGKAEFSGPWGNWSVAGMVRQIRSDGAVVSGVADSDWGAAVSVSGRIRLLEQDSIRFSAAWGNALGRYLSFNAFDDGAVDANGRIRLTEMFGGFASYQHWWAADLRSSVAVGYARADNDPGIVPGSVTEEIFSSHLNLLWSPTPRVTLGVEWIHGVQQLEDGRDGSIDRIQLTSVYRF